MVDECERVGEKRKGQKDSKGKRKKIEMKDQVRSRERNLK